MYGFQQEYARLLKTQVENQLVSIDFEVTLQGPRHWIKLINGNLLEPKFQISIEQIPRNNNGIPNGDLNSKETRILVQKPASKKVANSSSCQSSKTFMNMMAMVYIFEISKSSMLDNWKI